MKQQKPLNVELVIIIIAEDVEPPEVVAHLPLICEEQSKLCIVPSKQELGKLWNDVTSAATAILDSGDAQHIVDEVGITR